jgi:hypothetical protein
MNETCSLPAAALLLLTLATAGCSPQDETPPAPAAPPADTAPVVEARPLPPDEYDRSILEQARAEETPHLPATGVAEVARTGWDRLEITTADGTRRVFADSVDDGHLLWVHVFHGRLAPINAYVVEKRLIPEGWEFVVVEGASGRTTEVDVPPAASPDGRRFVTANQDLVAGYLPNRIRVYRMEASGPVMEWEHEPRSWGAGDPVWEDARTIRLTWWALTDDHHVEDRPTPLYLDLTASGWALREAVPADE